MGFGWLVCIYFYINEGFFVCAHGKKRSSLPLANARGAKGISDYQQLGFHLVGEIREVCGPPETMGKPVKPVCVCVCASACACARAHTRMCTHMYLNISLGERHGFNQTVKGVGLGFVNSLKLQGCGILDQRQEEKEKRCLS